MPSRRLILCAVISCVAPLSALAQPLVPAVARFGDDGSVSSERLGRVLAQELNCVACHKHDSVEGKQGPILTEVSSRINADYIKQFIGQPQMQKPGTTMPDLFSASAPEQKELEVTALVNYLMTLGDGQPPQGHATYGARRRGEALYQQVGCAVCHDSLTEGAVKLPTSVPHADLAAKYTLPSLSEFLVNPLHVRPSGRMPSLSLTPTEASDIAAFLLPAGLEVPGIEYQSFQGEWDRFPDLSRVEPSDSGVADSLDLGLAGGGQYYAMRFTGNLVIDRQGEYTFHVGSTHQTKVLIDGQVVVRGRARGDFAWRSNKVVLAAGRHDVAIDFVGRPREVEDEFAEEQPPRVIPKLELEFEGQGIERQSIVPAFMAATAARDTESSGFQVDQALALAGRSLFASKGCASCHEVVESGRRVESTIIASALKAVSFGGCLSPTSPTTPNFALDEKQQEMLISYLVTLRKAPRRGAGEDAGEIVAHNMLTYNCFACHTRDRMGGVEFARDERFQTTELSGGDEVRIPPPIDGVGAKFKEDWLLNILSSGANDRPYMLTRMPGFGAANAGEMAKLFAEIDHVEPLASEPLDLIEAKRVGRQLVGDKGFACTTCHNFDRYEAPRIRAMDLTGVTERLREDWFRRYLRDPQVYRPGTQMPSAWPATGVSMFDDLLDGDSDKQIHAMWEYLSDGELAKTPSGLDISR